MVKIQDVLNVIPEEAWEMQMLSQCMTGAEARKRPFEHTSITFGTDQVTVTEIMRENGKVGILLWVDRKEMSDAIRKLGSQ